MHHRIWSYLLHLDELIQKPIKLFNEAVKRDFEGVNDIQDWIVDKEMIPTLLGVAWARVASKCLIVVVRQISGASF